MMYTLACRDAGMMNCDFVARGEDKEDVVEMSMNHVKKIHPEKVEEMEMMPEEKVMALIKEA